MSGLVALIRALDTGDPDETAAAVFDAVGCPKKWRDLFGSIVRDECRRLIRVDARSAEAAGRHASCEPQRSTAGGGLGARAALLAATFFTGERRVTWGEATVEDHRARIAFLSTLRNGIDATIARHVAAVEQIEAAGATCLAAITDQELAA